MKTAVALIALAAACGSMTDETYHGEPLAKLHGVVSSDIGDLPDGVTMAIIWDQTADGYKPLSGSNFLPLEDALAGTQVDVDGHFPAEFTLTLYEPPPDYAMQESQGVHYAGGRLFAVDTARVIDNGDGSINVHDAIIGTTDRVFGDDYTFQQFGLLYQDAAFPDDADDLGAGYRIVRDTGQLVCQDVAPTVDGCIHFNPGPDPQTPDEIAYLEYVCTHPVQWEIPGTYPDKLAVESVDLSVTIATDLYFSISGASGVFPPDHLPPCPTE